MGKGLEEDVIPVAEALKWVQVWVAGDLQRLRDSEVGAENKGGGKKRDSLQWYQAGLGIKGPRLELNNVGSVQSRSNHIWQKLSDFNCVRANTLVTRSWTLKGAINIETFNEF